MSGEFLEDALAWSLGRYTMHGEIASGGMATVHIGRLQGTAGFSKMVAIKRLHAQFAKDPDFVSMFLDEARLVARVHHPNVVQPLDVIATDGEVFLVMEYIKGESLSKIQKFLRPRGQRVPLKIVGALMVGVLHGLHAAHEATNEQGQPLGIVHRDVSPQNIMLGTDGVARVLDFGIAKAADRAYQTQEGDLKGKLAYMAPEQLHGEADVDRRSDIYAASIVLWEMLTGRRLFDSDTQSAIVARAKAMDAQPPSQIDPDLSPELDRVVLKGLAHDPDERYLTAREMAIDLEMIMPLATPSKVGEWVEEVARESLERRSGRIKEIEQARQLPTASEHARAVLDELSIDEATRPALSAKSVASARPFRPEERERSVGREQEDEVTGAAAHVEIPQRLPPMRAPARSVPRLPPASVPAPPRSPASVPAPAPSLRSPSAPSLRSPSAPSLRSPSVPSFQPPSAPRSTSPPPSSVPAPPPAPSAPAVESAPAHMQRLVGARAALSQSQRLAPPSIRSAPSPAHAPPASSRLVVEDLPSVIIAPVVNVVRDAIAAATQGSPSFAQSQPLSQPQPPAQSPSFAQSQPLHHTNPGGQAIQRAPSQPFAQTLTGQPFAQTLTGQPFAQTPFDQPAHPFTPPEAFAPQQPSFSPTQTLTGAQPLSTKQYPFDSSPSFDPPPSFGQSSGASQPLGRPSPFTQSQPYFAPSGAPHGARPGAMLSPPQIAAFELPHIPPMQQIPSGPGAIDLSGGKRGGTSFLGVLLFTLIGLGALYLALPSIVKWSYVSAAGRRGIQLAVDDADVSRTRIRLLGVTATASELPGFYLHANELDFGLRDIDPDMMVARDVELTIDGPYAPVRDALQRWLGAHPLRAGNFKGGIRRIQITRAHVVWGRAFGDTSKLDFDDVTGTVGRVEEHALGEDFKLDAGRVTIGTPIGPLGPWTLSVARSPVSLSAALGLGPPGTDGAGVSFVDQDNGGITLDLKVPRATVDHVGIPKASLGAAVDEAPMQVEGTLKFSRPMSNRVASEGAFALHGLRLAGASAAVDVSMQARLVGDANTAMQITDGVMVFGAFKARIWGKVTLSRDGLRIDAEWRSAPRSCGMAMQADPTANIPQLAFDPTAVERAVSASPFPGQTAVGGVFVLDSRDLGQTRMTARSTNKCNAKIFP